MNTNVYFNKYRDSFIKFHKWRNELDIIHKVMLALSFAVLTGLMAQIRIVLPFSPVPITGQTFAVLLAGIILGRWGGASMAMYVGIGVAGIPWFTNWQGGFTTLTGATGGYLLGFILAASLVGYMTERYIKSRRFFALLPMLLFANFVLIYIPGLLVLYFWMGEFVGPITIANLLNVGLMPFIAGDLFKVAAAAGIARPILPVDP